MDRYCLTVMFISVLLAYTDEVGSSWKNLTNFETLFMKQMMITSMKICGDNN